MRAVATTVPALAIALVVQLLPAHVHSAMAPQPQQTLVARGRYLVEIANCNSCHTAAPPGVTLLEKDWLEGSRRGFHGPWGTTYPVNLRLLVGKLSQADWLAYLHAARPRPPMPWKALQAMTTEDQKAVYAFLRYLGPAGKEAPNDLPPGVTPPPPVVSFPMPPTSAGKPAGH